MALNFDLELENIFTDVEIQSLEEMLKDATADDHYEANEVSWIQLQIAARDFLFNLKKLEIQYNMIQNNLIKIKQISTDDTNEIAKQLQKNRAYNIMQQQYFLAFTFDKKLNSFLEGLPKYALYVYEDSKGNLSTFKMSLMDLAKKSYEGNRLDISLKQLQSEFNKALEQNADFDSFHIAQAQAAYKGVNARLQVYYDRMEKRQAQGGLLMWKINREWFIARITNKGDLKEAYVSALMVQHNSDNDVLCNVDTGVPQFYSHELISNFFYNFIEKVTNKAAITEEDIVTADSQYSVKGARASLPSLNQFESIASYIISKKEFLTKEQLKQEINQLFPQDEARNKILWHGKRMTKAVLEELELNRKDYTKIRKTIDI